MPRFNQDNRQRGRGGFNRGDRRDSGERKMYDAVCDECGRNCKVPFQASSDKPIYCSDCFEKKGNRSKGRSDDRGSDRRSNGRGDSTTNINSQAIDKLSKNIEILSTKIDSLINSLSTLKKTEVKTQEADNGTSKKEEPKAVVKKEKSEVKKVKSETKRSKEPKKKPAKKTSTSKAKK